jgi:5,10-methylenetetrahydromethanopterin reductase
MSIATMDEFAPGRVIASPGTGNAAALKEAGMESPHPLQTMREYVEILRRYLKGEAVKFHGKMFQINGAKMGFAPARAIDMYITAVRPLMLRLGGEIGDGVLLSGGCSPGYIARCVQEIQAGAEKAGKTLEQCDVAGFVTAAVSNDPKEAVEANKLFLAYIFRNVHHAENIRLGGGTVDQEGLAAAVAKRDWEAAKQFISDEIVHAHSIAGTPADCRKQLENFVAGGLSLPILLPTGTQPARRQVVQMARELAV